MATQQQIEALLAELQKAPPLDCFQNIDKNAAGFRAILQYLHQSDDTVTAGMISAHMNVSTARVAVLLKKMAAKGLIEKETDPSDGRLVIVKLSARGAQIAEELHNSMLTQVSDMIDKIGMDRMMEFISIAKELHSILPPPDLDVSCTETTPSADRKKEGDGTSCRSRHSLGSTSVLPPQRSF